VQVNNFELKLDTDLTRVDDRVLELNKLAFNLSSSLLKEIDDILFPQIPGYFPDTFSFG
jgi:hypothetical protein